MKAAAEKAAKAREAMAEARKAQPEAEGLQRQIDKIGEEEKKYQPALDTHKISVGMVIGRIDAQGTEHFLQTPTEDMQAFWDKYMALKDTTATLDKIFINQL